MPEAATIDDMINNTVPEGAVPPALQEKPESEKVAPVAQSEPNEITPEIDPVEQKANEEEAKGEPEPKAEPKVEPEKSEDSENSEKPNARLDEYGNEVPPPRMYTEEELQTRIRDRVSRGQQQPAPTQQAQQAQQQGFEYDENSEQPWEVQLGAFIDNRVEKLGERNAQKAKVQHEQKLKQDFETKFNQGMSRYPDFVAKVGSQPITDNMMMGARGVEDPTAFLYAAAKTQGDELRRISQLDDPYKQITEMGKLHQKMVKSPKSSNAPRPVRTDNSDIQDTAPAKVSIEDRIHEHGRSKRR